MTTGAIQLNKKELPYSYSFKKIRSIGVVVVSYVLSYVLIKGMITHFETGVVRLLKDAYNDFGVFWYMYALVILYFLLPGLYTLYSRYPVGCTLSLVCLCVSIGVYNDISIYIFDSDYFVQSHVLQFFRIWTWAMYYCVGASVMRYYNKVTIRTTRMILLCILIGACAITYFYNISYVATSVIDGCYVYDSFLMILFSTVVLILALRCEDKVVKLKREIDFLIPALIPIYSIHCLYLKIVEHNPLFTSSWMQIIGYLLVLCLACLSGLIMFRVPLLKRLTYI
jgi:surface polysaccharide O-acyltransferase-like enzyme